MMIQWLVFWSILACNVASSEKKWKEQQGDAQYHSSKSAPHQTSHWQGKWKPIVWTNRSDNSVAQSIAAQLKAPLRQWSESIVDSQQGMLNIIILNASNDIPTINGEVVFVLEGNWSKHDIASLAWKGAGIISIADTMSLFTSLEYLADPQLKAGVVAWQLAEHYRLPRQRLDRDLPIGLYGILGTEEADNGHENPHMRYFVAEQEQDSVMLVRLATARKTKDQLKLQILATDTDPWVRARAMDRVENVQILEKGLADPSSLVRVVAGHQLAELAKTGHKESCHILKKQEQVSDAYLRWKIAYGLGFCDAIEPLVRMLNDVDIDVQRQAAQSLGKQRNLRFAKEALIHKISASNSFVRRWVIESLARIHSPDVQQILEKIWNESPSILERELVGRVLETQGRKIQQVKYQPPAPPQNQKELQALVNSVDPTTRKDAAKFLFGRNDVSAEIQILAQDPDSEIRKSAIEAMGWNGDPKIYQFLKDSDPDVLVTALDGIRQGKIGKGEGLELFLTHSDTEIRLRATQAMAVLFSSLTVPQKEVLRKQCYDPDERIRAAALMVYPEELSPKESSEWVRWKIALQRGSSIDSNHVDMATLAIQGDLEQKAWVRGVVEFEDEFLHRRFSWNDEKDRPPSHRSLRPPLFRDYGFPNRG